MKIYKVLSNLKNGGTFHEVGTFVEDETEQLEHLVKEGVLVLIEGAENIGDAEILSKKIDKTKAQDDAAEAAKPQPQNTWGPKPDKQVAQVNIPDKQKDEGGTTEENKPTPVEVGQGDVAPKGDETGNNL